MRKFQLYLVFFILIQSTICSSEVKEYKTLDNSGLNKNERIESIDKYLLELSSSLKNMDSKLDENAKKLHSLEQVVNAMKVAEAKKVEPLLGEKKSPLAITPKESQLKNPEFEKMKVEFKELKDTVEALQATIRQVK